MHLLDECHGPAPSPQDTARMAREQWTAAQHTQVELEIAAAHRDGIALGIALAVEVTDRAVRAALQRPEGHGGVNLDDETRQRVHDLYARYLGVGVRP